MITVKTKPYKPLKYPLVTTTDSAQYFVVNSDTIFLKETIQANMGGDTTNKLWSAFLQKNVDDLVPARHSAPGGLYAVTVSFFVNKDGSISNVQIVHNPGYGTAEEVQRVMAESPKWQAGIYKGQKVKSLNRQTIYFAVTEE